MDNELPELVPGIYLVGTPIGNLEDITLRALRVLAGADVLVCEDTRVTRKLFQRHSLPTPPQIFSCNDHTERTVAKRLIRLAGDGKIVVFCSDAGMPGVSDPGYHLAREAREAGVRLEVIPGPSAVAMAVALSGIAAPDFTFLGFPPRRDGRLAKVLLAHGGLRPAMVFFESPRRLGRLMRLAAEQVGRDRRAAICLELTKKFERVERGTLADLADRYADREERGEATVVIEGAERGASRDEEDDNAADDDMSLS